VEAKDNTRVVIDYRVYEQTTQLPVNSMQVLDLIRALDHINVPVSDIVDLIFKLSRADTIGGEVVFLDE
jgi:HD-like signal output (HDOD) protein